MRFLKRRTLMNLKSLSDSALLESTREAAKNERHSTTVVLHHLLEVYDRRLFSPEYESLHEYAVDDLKYNDGEAHRRINAMWVLRAVPEVDKKIDSGSLNLTTLSQAQVFFRREAKTQGSITPELKRELLSTLENKRTRQVDRELIARATEPVLLKKERVRAVSDTLSELKCLVNDETLEVLKKIRGLLAHKHPDLSMGELLSLTAKLALEQLDPGKEPKRKRSSKVLRTAKPAPEVKPQGKAEPSQGCRDATPAREVKRYIPAAIRRQVWRRAQGKCTLCGSLNRPQIDHITPLAIGGSNELENLRILCFHCNQREADQKLGRPKMELQRRSA
jgi:5-methylcytosine-specific restriction endonuclease McrA